MPYNLSAIMTRAWEIYRTRFALTPNRAAFRLSLQDAWAESKRAVMQREESPEARKLADDITILESKNYWSQDDYAKRRELADAHSAQMEADKVDLERKRDLIASAKGRFATVIFIKKDGTRRQMRIQPATLKKHIKGAQASAPAQKAAQTRSKRHPHLMPVWDVEASAPRSVNLATVSRIAVNGAVHEYAVQ